MDKNQLKKVEDDNRKRILALLEQIPQKDMPNWKVVTEIAIGGLVYVGFSELESNKLLLISTNRKSVIDCNTGEVSFCKDCDYDEDDLFCIQNEFLNGEKIHLCGIGGGGLRKGIRTGESVEKVSPQYPKEDIIFQPSFKSCFLSPKECFLIYSDYEIRAYGFSKCGNYLVVAVSSDVKIWRRM